MVDAAILRYNRMMGDRHRVFLSFHHGDEGTKDAFVQRFGSQFDGYLDTPVRDGDISPQTAADLVMRRIRAKHIRDATVTVVLIGNETWRRKHVDWEIDASLRHTDGYAPTGLVGIVLPEYRLPQESLQRHRSNPPGAVICPYNIPPRLWDNARPRLDGRPTYALIRPWPQTEMELRGWIHEAFMRREQEPAPELSRPRHSFIHPYDQECWHPRRFAAAMML